MGKRIQEWLEAKRRCGLTDDDIRKAKALGMQPKSLLKNIPSSSQKWKAPVRDWARSLHAEKFGRRGSPAAGSSEYGSDPVVSRPRSQQRPQPAASAAPPDDFGQGITDDDVPF